MAEILLKLKASKVAEVSYTLKIYYRKEDTSKIKIFKTIWRCFKMIAKLKKRLRNSRENLFFSFYIFNIS